MEYDVDVTNDHPLAGKFAFNFNNMVKADGGKGIFPENAIAISLDDAERAQGRAVLRRTMDSALGVVTRGTSDRTSNKRMLMCEFRFNYRNWKNISKTELEEKVENAKTLLRTDYTGSIEPKCFFIFNKNIYQQVKNHFARIYNSRTKNRVVSTEEIFRKLIF